MSKNDTTIIPINENVAAFFKYIQICGTCTEHQALQFLNENELRLVKASGAFTFASISCKRKTLKIFKKNNVISKEEYIKASKSQIPQVGTLSVNKLGRRFMERKFNLKDVISCNGQHHNLMLGAKFMKLDEEERKSAVPEAQVRRELKKEIIICRRERRNEYEEMKMKYENKVEGFSYKFEKQCNYGSPVDFAYCSSNTGEYIGYEQTTKSYSSFDCAVKSFSCDVLGWTYEEGKI